MTAKCAHRSHMRREEARIVTLDCPGEDYFKAEIAHYPPIRRHVATRNMRRCQSPPHMAAAHGISPVCPTGKPFKFAPALPDSYTMISAEMVWTNGSVELATRAV